MTLKAYYWKYSLWAAILNTISIIVYLSFRRYENAWILYVGNLLFGAVVMIGVFRGYHRVHDTASLRSSFMMGFKITIYGVLLATVLCGIVLLINSMFTGLNDSSNPPQSGRGDVLFTILSNTIGVNAVLGALGAALGSTVVKKNQKTEHGKTLY
jgi:magnesium-transporting ATPase (P-type)